MGDAVMKNAIFVLTLMMAVIFSFQAFAGTTFLPDAEEGGDPDNIIRITENLN